MSTFPSLRRPRGLAVGDVVPPLERPIDLTDMVAYAGATWDWHKLHYDAEYAAAKKLPGTGRRRPGLRRAAGRAAPGLARPAVVRPPAVLHASATWSSPARPSAAQGEVTEVGDDRITVALSVVVVPEDGSEDRAAATPASRRGAARAPRRAGCDVIGGDPGRRRDRRRRRESDLGVTDRSILGAADPGGHPRAGRRRPRPRRRRRPRHHRHLAVLRDPAGRLPRHRADVDRLDLRRRVSAYEMYVARAAQAIRDGPVLDGGDHLRLQPALGAVPHARRRASRPHARGAVRGRPTTRSTRSRTTRWRRSAYLHDHGGTREQLAEFAVAAREWALLNPLAFRYGAGPADRRRRARVADGVHPAHRRGLLPGHRRRWRGRAHLARPGPRPARTGRCEVLGYGERTTNTSMTAVDDLTLPGAVGSGRDAFGRAGITPADVDVLEVYDSFTITAALSVEALGFCGRGEVLDFDRRRPHPAGRGAPAEHRRRRAVLLPPRPVRRPAAGRGGAPAPRGVRRAPGPRSARSRVAHGTGGILSTHATVVLGVAR